MNKVKTVTIAIKTAMSKSLSDLALEGLEEANKSILDQSASRVVGGSSLNEGKQAIIDRFSELLEANFDELLGDGHREVNVLDYGTLSLV